MTTMTIKRLAMSKRTMMTINDNYAHDNIDDNDDDDDENHDKV